MNWNMEMYEGKTWHLYNRMPVTENRVDLNEDLESNLEQQGPDSTIPQNGELVTSKDSTWQNSFDGCDGEIDEASRRLRCTSSSMLQMFPWRSMASEVGEPALMMLSMRLAKLWIDGQGAVTYSSPGRG